eukprot:scaffold229039_cov45-Tisochrysis_lutea.AAC.2
MLLALEAIGHACHHGVIHSEQTMFLGKTVDGCDDGMLHAYKLAWTTKVASTRASHVQGHMQYTGHPYQT